MSKACDKSLIIANFDSRLVIYDKIGTANLIYMRTFLFENFYARKWNVEQKNYHLVTLVRV